MSNIIKKLVVEFLKNAGGSVYKAYRNTVYTKGTKKDASFKSYINEKTNKVNNKEITKEEAYKILNFKIEDKPTNEQIIERYNDYFNRNSDENGGGAYLRSKINNSKDILLKK